MSSAAPAQVGLPFQEASGCKAPVGRAGSEGGGTSAHPYPGARVHSGCHWRPGLQTRAALRAAASVTAEISLIGVSVFIFRGAGMSVTVLSEAVCVLPRNTTLCGIVANTWTHGENGLGGQHSERSSVTLQRGPS